MHFYAKFFMKNSSNYVCSKLNYVQFVKKKKIIIFS